MSERQLETLERGIAKALADASSLNEAPALCCTFEAQNTLGAEVWIQVLAGTINALYPPAEDPLVHFRSRGMTCPAGVEVLEWEPSAFVTFSVEGLTTRDQAFFVDQLFTNLLLCGPADYVPVAKFEQLEQ